VKDQVLLTLGLLGVAAALLALCYGVLTFLAYLFGAQLGFYVWFGAWLAGGAWFLAGQYLKWKATAKPPAPDPDDQTGGGT
jgi:hypothetical protein